MKVSVLHLDLQPLDLRRRSLRAHGGGGPYLDDDIVMAAERDGIKDTDIEGAPRVPVVGCIRLSFMAVGAAAAGGDCEGGDQNISGPPGDPPAVFLAPYTV